MNIEIKNQVKAEMFAMMFQHIKSFSDHINIMFEHHQMYVQCMDNSRVSIMELRLPAAWFDAYTHTNAECITIGLSSQMLFRVLNARDKTQEMNIVYDNDGDKLFLHYTSNHKTEFDKHFELPLMEIDSETLDIPVIEYQADLTLSSQHFASIVSQLKMFGDTMEIQCSEDKIMLVSYSQDQGKMFVEINIDDVSNFAIEEGSALELSYSLTYLYNICLYNKLAKNVDLQFSSSYPMRVKYNLGHEDANMVFYLAPKVIDE
jgi:proliferating cell nuclear antigen